MIVTKRTLWLLLLCLGVIGWIVWAGMGRNNPQRTTDRLTQKLSRHIIVPNEPPVIAEVQDVSKLQSSLKKTAQRGDMVMVYNKSQKVIIYRPSTDKIVDVQPILYGSQPNAVIDNTVAIYNGSGDPKAMAAMIKKLYAMYPSMRLQVKDDAPRSFPTTIVYTPQRDSTLSRQIAEGLRITPGNVPEDMPENPADITIVIGTDQQ